MKKIFSIIFVLILALSCKAQTINIEDFDGNYSSGAYYKDTNNLLNPFEGTYVYTNGNNTLKLILRKVTMSNRANYFNEDLLIGEYQYVENGVEKINTLAQANVNYPNQINHSIDGNDILEGTVRGCNDCAANEIRVGVSLNEPTTNNFALVILRQTTSSGQPALLANFWWQARVHNEDAPDLIAPSFPGGDYLLIKQ